MGRRFFVFLCFGNLVIGLCQETTLISGRIMDSDTKTPLSGVSISVSDRRTIAITDEKGRFTFSILKGDNIKITFQLESYANLEVLWELGKSPDLGVLFMYPAVLPDEEVSILALTPEDLLLDEEQDVVVGFLQSQKEVFYRRAAFDFGQAFFRIRGYDGSLGKVYINGMGMNNLFNGRPQWSHWGGLNDVVRNQTGYQGLNYFEHGFGDLLGATWINTAPSGLRPGMRLTTSVSNRTYANRIMASYTQAISPKGFGYSVSASRRWAEEGYIKGTAYEAYSFYAGGEYQWNPKHRLLFSGFWASQKRGRSSALTQEVFDLVGHRYNPYWGGLNGDKVNSRIHDIREPFGILQYTFKDKEVSVSTSLMYQSGHQKNARVGYFNAPNPDPVYYRYLPSFYINSPIGANFQNADLVRNSFVENPQWDWNTLYQGNQGRAKAAYIWYDDVLANQTLKGAVRFNWQPKPSWQWNAGFELEQTSSENYAQIRDLLGAEYHRDIDPFSETLNDLDGEIDKGVDNRFSYNYDMSAASWSAYIQSRYKWKKWEGFVSGNYGNITYQRTGVFRNGRYPDDSKGKGPQLSFTSYGVKTGLIYQFNGRHRIGFNGLFSTMPPLLRNSYVNPRENHQTIPDLSTQTITAWEAHYWVRLPKLTARFTGYHTHFQNASEVAYFFTDAGVGSDFVQQVTTQMDTRHLGAELGLTYHASPVVDLSLVTSIGRFTYANNPLLTINFDTAGSNEDFINPEGFLDLGATFLRGDRLSQGPQTAVSVGVHYRDPKYWWAGATLNYLGANYIGLSRLARTQSFGLDPETGDPFGDVTDADIQKALVQKPLPPIYYLNLTGGKSWKLGDDYLSLFISLNNVFDGVFKTGGYEQNRNGNYGQWYQDNLSGNPSFGPKHWYGYGRTFFVNIAYSPSLKNKKRHEK